MNRGRKDTRMLKSIKSSTARGKITRTIHDNVGLFMTIVDTTI